MGSRLGVKTTTYVAPENYSWVGSAHGLGNMESGTLSAAAFASFNGLVPSGVLLAKNVAGTRLVPFVSGASDATGKAVGHLGTTTVIGADDTSVPVYWHGRVIVAKLPAASGYVAGTVPALLPQIRYV